MTLKQAFVQLKGNKIGLAILGLGALAFLFVIFLAYQSFMKPEFGSDAQTLISTTETQKQDAITKPTEPTLKRTDFKRQKSISENQITGSWSGRIKDGRALVQLSKGTYRLIISRDNPNESRLYSNGTYKLQGDILILEPNSNWGPPKNSRFGYRILTHAKMPVQVLKHKGKVVWLEPGADADVFVPNFHPLLSRSKDKIVVFDVLK